MPHPPARPGPKIGPTDETMAPGQADVGTAQTMDSGPIDVGTAQTMDSGPIDVGAGARPTDRPTVKERPGPPDFAELQPVNAEHYVVEREVARGGMGRIVAARDRRLRRKVALKELLPNDAADTRRFEREALITARLQHPGIVRVYEAGRWSDGRPFYAMELVDGRPLDRVIADADSLDARLSLLPHVQRLTDALAYAHAHRIIHRDLKPGNILCGTFGETLIIDWGLAKELDDPNGDAPSTSSASLSSTPSPNLTVTGAVMGTPSYMPPEQARGSAVDERADVYAVGAILYHLLSGSPPYRGNTTHEVLAKLLSTPPAPLPSGVPRDLQDLVEKAMASDPAARYPSARELKADLERFLTGQLVGAHRYSLAERVRRFARKHGALLSVTALALVSLSTVAVLSVRRILAERAAAVSARADADRERNRAVMRADRLTLGQAQAALARDPTLTLAWLKELSLDSPEWPTAVALARQAVALGVAHVLTDAQQGNVDQLTVSRDGRFASAGPDHVVRLWDGEHAKQLAGHHGAVRSRLAFSPDGAWLASGSVDQTLRLWPMSAAVPPRVLEGHAGAIRDLAFSPDGKRLASAADDGTVRLWDPETRSSRTLISAGASLRSLAFSPDGTHLAAAGEDGLVLVVAIAEPKPSKLAGHTGVVRVVRFAPDGRRLVSAGEDGTVRLWELADGRGRVIQRHGDAVKDLELSPDGKWVAAAGGDRLVRLSGLGGEQPRTLAGHTGGIKRLGFSSDGKLLASTSLDKTVRVWDVASGNGRALMGHAAQVNSVGFSPDGQSLYTGSDDGTVRAWPLAPPPPPPAAPAAMPAWLGARTNLTVPR
jgi:WD40 repeat protein/tRNA A-37 threonylcarbamoyl transferase component Bud32